MYAAATITIVIITITTTGPRNAPRERRHPDGAGAPHGSRRHPMQFFLDSANYREIEHWLRQGVIDGVTTNDHTEMLEQARVFARWAPNIVVKIPVVNEYGESCLGVIHALSQEGIPINTTTILSFNQAILAAKAGATYVSIFAGRVADEGNDPGTVIRQVRQWLDEWDYAAQILVGSIRAVMDVQNAAIAGAHIVTIPPQFLPKMVDHKYSRDTVRQFNQDAEKAMAQIAQAKMAT